ncbi:MAG TPA: hypothetical protein VFE28_03665 [Candidatus Krumholzibacteria bacterium]|nr:hypothetical protein [Candidatus Krumholzibacteria bacterium]
MNPGLRLVHAAIPRPEFHRSFRGTSDLILLDIDSSWGVADPCVTGAPQPAVVDGFWIMLAPLPPGVHTLHFHSELPDFGGFMVDVTYNLTVQPGGRRRGSIAGAPGAVEASTWGLVKRFYK